MLFAKAHNGKGFPIKARIRNGVDLFPNHCHEEMEIIEILDGNIHVTSGDMQWDLKKGDVLMLRFSATPLPVPRPMLSER